MKPPSPNPRTWGDKLAYFLMHVAGSWPFVILEIALLNIVLFILHWKMDNIDFDVSLWTLFMDNIIVIGTMIFSKFQLKQAEYMLHMMQNQVTALEEAKQARDTIVKHLKEIIRKLDGHTATTKT